MSRVAVPITFVGSEFVIPRTRLHVAVLGATPQPAAALPIAPALPLQAPREFIPPAELASVPVRLPGRLLNFLHRHSLVTFALLFLLVGSAATQVAGNYQAARIEAAAKPALALKSTVPTIAGLNLTVPSGQLQAKLQTITSQPATLTVGTQSVAVSPDTIKSWLQITSSADKSQDYIRIKAGAITASLNQLTNTYVKAPVSQVTVTHTDGTPSGVIVAGQNGTMLTDPGSLATQAQQIAKTVMDGKGLQFSTPLQSVPFQAVTPAAFGKLLEADVTTNRLYAYENGQLVNTFLATAGAPATPTPIGEFHIWAKFTVQTMKGFNPNGTPYIQPNVPWINYFDHSGDAVHGNYWRPASVFGNVSTSHGCVGIQVNDAEWVYNWAPIGTTVITHA